MADVFVSLLQIHKDLNHFKATCIIRVSKIDLPLNFVLIGEITHFSIMPEVFYKIFRAIDFPYWAILLLEIHFKILLAVVVRDLGQNDGIIRRETFNLSAL